MSLKINDLLHIPPCDICRLPKMSSRLWTEAGHRIPMSNGAVYDENGKARMRMASLLLGQCSAHWEIRGYSVQCLEKMRYAGLPTFG